MSKNSTEKKIFIVEKLIEEGKPFNYKHVLQDLKNGFITVLYFAKPDQVDYIIQNELFDGDISETYEIYQEDMRVMKNEFENEFKG